MWSILNSIIRKGCYLCFPQYFVADDNLKKYDMDNVVNNFLVMISQQSNPGVNLK